MLKNKKLIIAGLAAVCFSASAQTLNPFSGEKQLNLQEPVANTTDTVKEKKAPLEKNIKEKVKTDKQVIEYDWFAFVPVKVLSKVKTQGNLFYVILQSPLGISSVKENEVFELGVVSIKKEKIFLNNTEIFYEFDTQVKIPIKK